MSIQGVREGRNLPFIKRGMRVQIFDGAFGRITGGNRQMNINVRLDGCKKSNNYHPTWRMRYFDTDGDLIAEYKD